MKSYNLKKKCVTNHWREIFDPAAQIFLNSVVKRQKGTSWQVII